MARVGKSTGEVAGAAFRRIQKHRDTYLFPPFHQVEELTLEWSQEHRVPLGALDDLRRDATAVIQAFGKLPWPKR